MPYDNGRLMAHEHVDEAMALAESAKGDVDERGSADLQRAIALAILAQTHATLALQDTLDAIRGNLA